MGTRRTSPSCCPWRPQVRLPFFTCLACAVLCVMPTANRAGTLFFFIGRTHTSIYPSFRRRRRAGAAAPAGGRRDGSSDGDGSSDARGRSGGTTTTITSFGGGGVGGHGGAPARSLRPEPLRVPGPERADAAAHDVQGMNEFRGTSKAPSQKATHTHTYGRSTRSGLTAPRPTPHNPQQSQPQNHEKQTPHQPQSPNHEKTTTIPIPKSRPQTTKKTQTFALWLDDARCWSHLPYLDLSHRALAVRTSRRGR